MSKQFALGKPIQQRAAKRGAHRAPLLSTAPTVGDGEDRHELLL
ncbi:MAG: hypothetical protein ACYC0T_10385 [Ramlibacter sp.]